MSNRIDPDNPVTSLLESAKLTGSELARRMGIAQTGIPKAISRGDEISLAWLKRAAKAAGRKIDIRVPKK